MSIKSTLTGQGQWPRLTWPQQQRFQPANADLATTASEYLIASIDGKWKPSNMALFLMVAKQLAT
jgi:hypothetical protein